MSILNSKIKKQNRILKFDFCELNEETGLLTFNDGLTKITEKMLAVVDKTKIKKVEIPNSVEVIGEFVFTNCKNLEEVRLSQNLQLIDNYVFANCGSLKSVECPKTLQIIGSYAFSNCSNLESIKLNEGLDQIEASAFFSCKKIGGIEQSQENSQATKNQGGETIEKEKEDKKLKDLILPSTIKSIGDSAFANIEFNEVVLPKSLERLGYSFYCEGIKDNAVRKFSIDKQNANFKTMQNGKFLIQQEDFVNGQKNIKLIHCAEGESEEAIIIPENVTEIGKDVFNGFKAREIILPDCVSKIGMRCFSNCKNLKVLHLPEDLTSLPFNLIFKSSVEELYIGKNVKDISPLGLSGSDKLIKITLNSKNKNFHTDDAGKILFSEEVLFKSINGDFPSIPFTEIGSGCFGGKEFTASEFKIPNSVETIECGAFDSCANLTKVTLGAKTKIFNGQAFLDCPKLENFELSAENENFVLDSNKLGVYRAIRRLGKTFLEIVAGTKHTKLPENCEVIGYGAMTSMEGITRICSSKTQNLKTREINHNKDELTNDLTFYLPEKLRKIGNGGFDQIKSLKEIDLKGTNVMQIDPWTFEGCENLEKVHLSDIVDVGNKAFELPSENKLKDISISFFTTGRIEELLSCAGAEGVHFEVRHPIEKELILPADEAMLFSGNTLTNEAIKSSGANGEYVYVKIKNFSPAVMEINSPIQKFNSKQNIITKSGVIYFNPEVQRFEKIENETFKDLSKDYNKLHLLQKEKMHKIQPWIEAKHKDGIPPYFVIENLKADDIQKFYTFRKDWAEIAKKFIEVNSNKDDFEHINGKNDEKKQEPTGDEMRALFKSCIAFGVFEGINEQYKDYILNALIPNVPAKNFVDMFGKCLTERNGFNSEFRREFFHFFIDKKIAKNKYLTKGANFLSRVDYRTGEWISYCADFYNNFEEVENNHPNKKYKTVFDSEGKMQYGGIQLDDIIKTYCSTKYDETKTEAKKQEFLTAVQGFKNERGKQKYTEADFNNFVEVLEDYNETFEHFQMLCDALIEGIKNWENSPKERLLCEEDTQEDAFIKYSLLEKKDGHGAVLGYITDCCQHVGHNGGACVEYGMKMPNSGFLEFRYNGKIIGQSWVWYDKKTKQITLDNIEFPKNLLLSVRLDENFNAGMIDCLNRVATGFKNAMEANGEQVDKVTIGLSANEIKDLLMSKYQVLDYSQINELTDYEKNVCMKFGPEAYLDYPYSDAEKQDGQVLVADYTKTQKPQIKQEKELQK